MGEGIELESHPDNSGVIVILPENLWALTSEPVKRLETKQINGTGVVSHTISCSPFDDTHLAEETHGA